MQARSVEAGSKRKRRVGVWLAALVALGIGVVALGSAVTALGPAANDADRAAAIPNLLTGVASLAGGAGYCLGKRWGVIAYAVSVAGHLLIHGAFLLAAFQSQRLSPFSVVGLAIIPAVSLLVLAGMVAEERKGGLR